MSVFISHSVLFLGYVNDTPFFSKFRQLFLVQGDLGVNFFFVLSGFLITYLLFQENKKNGHISLKNFYLRRIIRIWPVYFLTIFVGFVVIPFIASYISGAFPFATSFNFHHVSWYLLFIANMDMSFFAAPNLFVAVLWSISVEEQFYLIWPLVIKKVRKEMLARLALFVVLVSFIGRLFWVYNYNVSSYFTVSVMSDLAIGALLAYMVEYIPRIKEWFTHLSRRAIFLIYACILVLIPVKGGLDQLLHGRWYQFAYAFLPILFSVLFALVIAEQNYAEHSVIKIGKNRVMSYLGKISYGLYAYHLVAFFAVLAIGKQFAPETFYTNVGRFLLYAVFAFFCAVLFASLSYTYIEKKFLLLKEKFNS